MKLSLRRCLALMLIIVLLAGNGEVFAGEADTYRKSGTIQGTVINPLYPVQTEAQEGEEISSAPALQATEGEYVSEAAAAELLRDAMVARETEFTIHVYAEDGTLDIEYELVPMVYSMELAEGNTDGDYLRWSFKSLSWTGKYRGNYYDLTFYAAYYTTAQQESALQTRVDTMLASLNLREKNTFQQIRDIYTCITDLVNYDYDALDRIMAGVPREGDKLVYTAYGAAINEKAVCQGYACLFYMMCRSVGIPVRIVHNEDHAWNIVQIDDLWYNMDATWDGQDEASYKQFFLRGSDNFPDHTPDGEFLTNIFVRAYPISATDYIPANENQCTVHGYDYVGVAKEATCTEPGEKTYVCRGCGITKGEPIPKLGHRESRNIRVEATCTEDGYIAKGCERCDYYIIEKIILKKGHNYTKTVTIPTCTAGGYTTYICPGCSDSYQSDEKPELGHDWNKGVVSKEATDTEDGEKLFTCGRCGTTKTEPIPANDHHYDAGVVTQEPTCTKTGIRKFTCTDPGCEKFYVEDIPIIEHDWDAGTVTGEASCAESGEKTYTCNECGATKTESITASGHRHKHVVTEPTCTEEGYTMAVCENCPDRYEVSRTPALDHEWDTLPSVVTPPQCTTGGYTTYTCSRCGATKTDNQTSPLGHDHQVTAQIPVTCSADGSKTEVCSRCGDTVISTIPTTGHSYETVVTEPTCTADGYTTHTCSGCGDSYIDGKTGAKGHSWDGGQVTVKETCTTEGIKVYTCGGCGLTKPETIPETGHAYNAGTVTVQPTAIAKGTKTYLCGNCGDVKTEQLSVEGILRISGKDRYDTAFKAADGLKESLGVQKFENIVVASGIDFADALSGSYLANQKNAPILLVRNNKNTMNSVKDYIKKNLVSGGTVYLLGGKNAIPAAMESGLDGFTVKRLAGNTRYDTNLEILKEAGVGDKDILVCTGKEFADGLSASAVNKPILLVKDSLNTAQKNFLSGLSGNKIYVIGGTNAVNAKTETALGAYGSVTRISGATRYDTSVNIAREFFPNASSVVLAYGQNFPDGLSAGSLACSMDAPLILTSTGKPNQAVAYATAAGIKSGAVLGGPTLISDKVVKRIFSMGTDDQITVK